MSEVFSSEWRRVVAAVVTVDAAVLAVVLGLTFASGGFDGGVVAGGLALPVFFAMMAWFYVAIRGSGYRPADRMYDAEFHAIQVDQYIQEPGAVRPRRMPRHIHAIMGGIVISLVVLMLVFGAL